jgi:hypothetical protein
VTRGQEFIRESIRDLDPFDKKEAKKIPIRPTNQIPIRPTNLEKILARLPRWMQAKFAEHLKSLESKGQVMPTFKGVVEFLRDRAYVLNHPFFTRIQNETVTTHVKFKSTGKNSKFPHVIYGGFSMDFQKSTTGR